MPKNSRHIVQSNHPEWLLTTHLSQITEFRYQFDPSHPVSTANCGAERSPNHGNRRRVVDPTTDQAAGHIVHAGKCTMPPGPTGGIEVSVSTWLRTSDASRR